MKQSVLRFAAQLWAMLAVLLLFVAAATLIFGRSSYEHL